MGSRGDSKKISSVQALEGVRVKSKSRFDRLLIGTSAIAMAVASAIAVAQENAQKDAAKATTAPKADEDSEVSTIVVTGIRAALETAAETKRHADTFVDSVTASDVASLPDMSVAEALQRVPGGGRWICSRPAAAPSDDFD